MPRMGFCCCGGETIHCTPLCLAEVTVNGLANGSCSTCGTFNGVPFSLTWHGAPNCFYTGAISNFCCGGNCNYHVNVLLWVVASGSNYVIRGQVTVGDPLTPGTWQVVDVQSSPFVYDTADCSAGWDLAVTGGDTGGTCDLTSLSVHVASGL